MLILDYLLYITHNFLILLRRVNSADIQGRVMNALAIMMFFLSFLVLTIVYMVLIRFLEIKFNSIGYFLTCISLFVLLSVFVRRTYRRTYDTTIAQMNNRFNYSNKTIVMMFILFWFIPILSFWGGILLFSEWLHSTT